MYHCDSSKSPWIECCAVGSVGYIVSKVLLSFSPIFPRRVRNAVIGLYSYLLFVVVNALSAVVSGTFAEYERFMLKTSE